MDVDKIEKYELHKYKYVIHDLINLMKRPDLITIRVEGEDMVEIIDTQPILEYLAQINLIQKGLKGTNGQGLL